MGDRASYTCIWSGLRLLCARYQTRVMCDMDLPPDADRAGAAYQTGYGSSRGWGESRDLTNIRTWMSGKSWELEPGKGAEGDAVPCGGTYNLIGS